jgi:ATP-dependent Clp protease ATP-binding subunit ClpA
MGEYLQSALSRGEITLITECTPGERANIEAKYPNYLPFFQTIYLQEPASEDLEFIITQKIQALAGQRRIRIELEAIREMIRLHRRFSPYSGMPGKPIRFLESILMGNSDPVLPTKKSKKKTSKDNELPLPFTLTRQVVLRHFCEESGIPQLMIDPEIRMDTKAIQRRFNTQVFGQEKAVNAAVNTLAAVKTALTRTGKPIASFLFIGPTGVGKTELAKVMAEFMFGNRERLVRFDMSEYSDFWSVMRLTGESYFSDGLLTSAVKREPFCLILFDEIEKADQSFLDLLLQILSEGRLTDSRGQLVNFCSAIIIMTSNVGASNFQLHPISYLKNQKVQRMEDHFIQAAERYFRPEFFNRIDSVLAFEPLSPEIMRFVVEREIDLFKNREGIHFRHLDLTLDDAVLDFLAKEGYDPLYGARYLQRTIREKLIAPLAQELNQFDYDDHLVVQIRLTSDTADGEKKTLRIIIESDPLGFDLLMEQWDKLTLAEQASHERRKWMVMQESPLFIRLQNEWEMLEISLARLGNAFWKNGVQAKLYADTSAIRERIRQLQTTIQNLEEEIALASMEQGIFQTDFNDRLEQWKEDFFQLLEDVYSLLFPKQNTCHLAIYGSDLEKLLHFYLRLFKEKGFQVKEAHSVWFHEKYATEKKLPRLPEKSPPQVTTEEEEDTEKPQNEATAYIRQPCSQQDLADQRFFPPDSNARMFGIELQVSGHIAWLYLKEEKGIQHWETDVKDDFTAYHIAVNLQKAPPPDGIHRNMFYQNSKPRRIVRQETITDTKLGIAETLKQEEMPLYLKEKLDERLRVNIGQAFRESEPEG